MNLKKQDRQDWSSVNSLDATVAVIHAFHSEIEIEQQKKKIKEMASREERDSRNGHLDMESEGREE